MNCVHMIDKHRWTRDDKGNLKKSKHKIPQDKMKNIIDWILNEVQVLSDEEVLNNVDEIIKAYQPIKDMKLMKDYVKKINDALKANYDVKFIVDNVYEKFGEIITTDEIAKIIALKKAL